MRKKIAILATYIGEIDRGAESFVIEFTKKLRQKYDISVFSKCISEEIRENITEIKMKKPFWFNIHRKFYERNLYFRKICNRMYYLIPGEIEQYYFSGLVYKNYLSKIKYDLIFPNNGVWGAKAAYKVRKKNGTPFIYTGHGGSSVGEIKVLKYRPDKYIALTEKYEKMSKKYYDSVIKIHNGVSTEKFDKKIGIKTEHKNFERPVILCVGAFNKMKRQKLLIDAFALMDKGFLILLGEGENEEILREYCENKIKSRYILEKVNYKDIPYYYQLCDIFTLPSEDEPFGIVYLEAMSANKPIVTTDDETRSEIIGDAGILCNVENPNEYAKSLSECYGREWNNIPKRRAINNFDWNKIIGDYEKVIEKVTNR